ncbi:MAG TPA: PAS domain S-box protein [Ignavibacteriaceae bacterium]|nr:PAS domain S-box protein [Ignavibacteriaceae bacterium]
MHETGNFLKKSFFTITIEKKDYFKEQYSSLASYINNKQVSSFYELHQELKNNIYDIIIIDVDGLERNILNNIQQVILTHPHIPVLVAGSDITSKGLINNFQIGAVDFLDKVNRNPTELYHSICSVHDKKNKHIYNTLLEDLLDKEKSFRYITEEIKELVCFHELDGTYKYLTSSVKEILGYEVDALIGKSPYSLIHPDDIEKVNKDFEKIINTPDSNKGVDYRVFHSNGNTVWLNTITKFIYEKDGKASGLITVSKDITTNKSKEKEVFENQIRLNLALESTHQGLFDVNIITGETYVSNEYIRMLGYDPQTFIDTYDGWMNRLHPDEKEYVTKYFNEYVTNKRDTYQLEFRQKTVNGDYIWILSTAKIIEWDENGNPKRIIGTHTNITSQKDNEKAVQENKLKYEQLFIAEPDAIIIGNVDEMRIVDVNQAACDLYGYNKDELTKLSLLEITANEVRAKEFFDTSKVGQSSRLMSRMHKHKNGTIFPVEISYSFMELNGNKYIFATLRDISEKVQNEKILIENEKKFKAIFDNSVDAIGVSKDGICNYANAAFVKLFGYGNDSELIGKSMRELVIEEERALAKSLYENKKTKKDPTSFFELNALKKDGTRVNISVHLSSYELEGDTYIVSIIRDVTLDKASKLALKESENQYRKTFKVIEQSPTSILITDENGNIEFVNKKFLEITGYQYHEVIGKKPSILKSGYTKEEEYKNIWETIVSGKEWKGEFHNKKKNGELFWEFALIAPIKDENGSITNFVAIKEDITESKLQDAKIKETETNFQYVWENSFDPMRLINEDGVVIRVNEAYCKLVNKTKEELENSFYSIIYEDADNSDYITKFKENFKNHSIKKKREGVLPLWDGRKPWAEVLNSYIFQEGKKPLVLTIFRDITERKNSELELIAAKEKAEEMSKIKTNFLNNMSHEIRTPMVGILGFAQILSSEIESPELREMVDEISKSGNRMMNTINSILDLSRIEANKMSLKLIKLNMLNEIEEIVRPLRYIAEQNDLYLKVVCKSNFTNFVTDKHLYTQIINNLVGNAIKYTRSGGISIEIDKSINTEGTWAVIKIIDTGIGIPDEAKEIIFEEFRQVSEGLNRQFEGTGLGLTITKKIVTLLKGKIEVNSELGKGSEFIVYLPYEENTASGKTIVQTLVNPSLQNKSEAKNNLPSVLLVENDSINRTVMNLFLNKICKIDLADNGEHSVALAKKNKYAAILMDINLGTGINGLEAAKEIKSIPGYEEVPIVAVTAYAMVGDKERFLANGCTHYISKPFDKETIVNLMSSIMIKN